MTSVRPLSCREDSSEGSWNTKTVTTSVAVKKEHRTMQVIHSSDFLRRKGILAARL